MSNKKSRKVGTFRISRVANAKKLFGPIERHLARGRHLFLLPPGSKVPAAGSHGFKDATTDHDALIKAAKEDPRANLGIRTGVISNLLAIDIDRHEGPDGFASLAILEAELGPLPKTLVTKTAGGGEHRLFLCSLPLKSQQNIAPGIDLRADDGYIVVPPSVVGGVPYVMECNGVRKIASLPEKWMNMLRSKQLFKADLTSAEPIFKGQRNSALTAVGFHLRHEGKSYDDCLAMLLQFNEARCKPPEKDARVRSLARRVYDADRSPPTVRPLRQTTTLASIDKLELKPLRWAVRRLVPEGVALLAGPPKIGKSILMLQMALAVATGSRLWRKKPEQLGEVLYLAYEESNRRLQTRSRQLFDGKKMPKTFHIDFDWPRMDAGGIQDLDNWLVAHPKARLVIVDTLAKFRGETTTKRSVYDYDYAVGHALVAMAAKHRVAIVLVHHTAKGHRADPLESVNSTNGLPGGVDTVMVLGRARSSEEGTLFVTGRDIIEEGTWAMSKTSAGWTVSSTLADAQRSPARQAILNAIEEIGASSPGQLANHLGKKGEAVRQLLMTMVDSGEVLKTAHGYVVTKSKK